MKNLPTIDRQLNPGPYMPKTDDSKRCYLKKHSQESEGAEVTSPDALKTNSDERQIFKHGRRPESTLWNYYLKIPK